MNLPDLYDALDKLSGFDCNEDGSPIAPYPVQLSSTIESMTPAVRDGVLEGWRNQAVDTLNAMTLEDRQALLSEWGDQRFLRPVQLVMDGTGADAFKVALEQLVTAGVNVEGDKN